MKNEKAQILVKIIVISIVIFIFAFFAINKFGNFLPSKDDKDGTITIKDKNVNKVNTYWEE